MQIFEKYFLLFIIVVSYRFRDVIASEAKQSLSLAGLRLPRPFGLAMTAHRKLLSILLKDEEMSSKPRARKSWREKLENPPVGLPKVVKVPPKWQKTMGGENILVPTPLLVDELIRKVTKRRLITVGQISTTAQCNIEKLSFLW